MHTHLKDMMLITKVQKNILKFWLSQRSVQHGPMFPCWLHISSSCACKRERKWRTIRWHSPPILDRLDPNSLELTSRASVLGVRFETLSYTKNKRLIHFLKLTAPPSKSMVGRFLSFLWPGLFSGANLLLDSGRIFSTQLEDLPVSSEGVINWRRQLRGCVQVPWSSQVFHKNNLILSKHIWIHLGVQHASFPPNSFWMRCASKQPFAWESGCD